MDCNKNPFLQNDCKGIKKVGKFEGWKVVKKSYFCAVFF